MLLIEDFFYELKKAPVNLSIKFPTPYKVITLGNFEIIPIELNHRATEIDTYGYIIKHKNEHSAVITLFDTKGLPEITLKYLSKNKFSFDLAIIDATNPPEHNVPTHNNVDDAIEIAKIINPKLAVLVHIAHYNYPYNKLLRYLRLKGVEKDIIISYDNMIINI